VKHCLVTGGAGFIGSHLTEALLARGDRVTVLDDESTGAVANLASVVDHARLRFVRGSAGDADAINPLVAEADEVYHLAAAVGVDLVVHDPIRTIHTNIQPTELVLKALRRRQRAGRPAKLFLTSSSEVYGKNPNPRFREDDDLVFGPTSLARWSYGASKAIDEMMALAYHRQHEVPVVIVRLFNVVGPRQSPAYGSVLPRFVRAALAGGPLVVYGDGQQIRSFTHVSDVISAALALMDQPRAVGLVTNVGSDQPVTIETLARQVVAAVNPALRIEYQSYRDAYGEGFEECAHRVPDLSRLKSLVGIRPQVTLDAIVRQCVDWWTGHD
jgi:UDP-glucose 4-epimerase